MPRLRLFAAFFCTVLAAHAQKQMVTATPSSIAFGTQTVGRTTKPLSYTANVFPVSVVTGDFNGDGKLDIAVANQEGGGSISVLFGNGDGTLQAPTNYADSPDPQFIVAADFNGDGKLDLAVADYTSGVSVFLNNGDGTFQQPPIDYPTGYGSVALTVGDVNGDGIPDLVTANYTGNTVSVLLGKGDGTFSKALTNQVGASAYSVVLGDFNGDGKIDIAVSLQLSSSGEIGVLLGNGNGTFQRVISSTTGTGPTGLVAADFNGDGKLDVAVGSEGTGSGDTLCLLLGKGDGTFQPPVNFTVGKDPINTVSADFNGDGKADLAVMSYGGANFIVLLGNGDGTFKPPVSYINGLLPYGLAVGDFTGRGVMDLVNTDPYFTSDVFLGNGNGTFQDYLVLLTNTGTVAANLKYSITGQNPKDFAARNTCAFLGPGGVCGFTTMFSPKAKGARTATLQILDTKGSVLATVALSGTGK